MMEKKKKNVHEGTGKLKNFCLRLKSIFYILKIQAIF